MLRGWLEAESTRPKYQGVGADESFGGQVGRDPRKAGKQQVCRQPPTLSREGFDSLCPLQFRYVLLRTLARSLNRASPGLFF